MPRSVLLGRPWPQPGEPLFTPEDTNWAIALHEEEAAEAAARCQLCGLPRSVCRDKENQLLFRAEHEQCHATWVIGRAQADMAEDSRVTPETKQATAWSASLPPSTV